MTGGRDPAGVVYEGQPGLDPPVELPDGGGQRVVLRRAATMESGRFGAAVSLLPSDTSVRARDRARVCRQRYFSMARWVSANASTDASGISSPAGRSPHRRRAGPGEDGPQ